MRKIISIILCVSLCMSMCITTALGAEETKGVKTVLEYKAVMSGIGGFINDNGLKKYAAADGTVHTSVPTTVQYHCRLNGAYEPDGKSIKVPTDTILYFNLNQSSDSTWPVGETRYLEYKFNFKKITGKYACIVLEIRGAYCEMKGFGEGENYIRAEIKKTNTDKYSMVAYGSGNLEVFNSTYQTTATTFKNGEFYVTEVNMGTVTEKRSTGKRQYSKILEGLSDLALSNTNHNQAAFNASGEKIAYSTTDKTNGWIDVRGTLSDNKIPLWNYSTTSSYCISTYNFPSNAEVGDIYKLKLNINITATGKFELSVGGIQSGKYFEVKNTTVGEHIMELIAEKTTNGYNCTLTWDGNNVSSSSWPSYTTNFLSNIGAEASITNIEIGVEKQIAAKGAILAPISERGRAKVEICQTQADTIEEAVLISAIYTADNELVGLNTYELPLEGKVDNKYYEYWCTATPEKEDGNLVYKAFLWDSMSGLTPIPASN